MDKKSENAETTKCCCQIESIVSVDERGQMVLSKELREKAGIKPGDKFAVSALEKNGKICCIVLVPVKEFSGIVKSIIGNIVE